MSKTFLKADDHSAAMFYRLIIIIIISFLDKSWVKVGSCEDFWIAHSLQDIENILQVHGRYFL